MTEADIDFYVGTGEPFGKAGAYGIQGVSSSRNPRSIPVSSKSFVFGRGYRVAGARGAFKDRCLYC